MAPLPFLSLIQSDASTLEAREALSEAEPFGQTSVLSSDDLTLRLLLTRRGADEPTLFARQSNGVFNLQGSYNTAGPSPGAVVGIILGSVGGFLLLIWLLWTLSNGTTFIKTTSGIEEVEEVEVRKRGTRSRRPRSRRTEMVESRSDISAPRRVYRSERIIRDFGSRSGSPSIARSRSRNRGETIIVEERRETRVPGDDIIEVEEDHSSYGAPRRKSRRSDRDRY